MTLSLWRGRPERPGEGEGRSGSDTLIVRSPFEGEGFSQD